MFKNGVRNISVFTGFFWTNGEGRPVLLMSEDRHAALPLFLPPGHPAPSAGEAINVGGHVAVIDGRLGIEALHVERAGANTISPRVDWVVRGLEPGASLNGEFDPIIKPGFTLKPEILASLSPDSGFGPAVHSAVAADAALREQMIRPLSRRMRNQVMLTGVVTAVTRNPVQPTGNSRWPFHWGNFVMGPESTDIVPFKFRMVSPGFAGVMNRFSYGPAPITLYGALRSEKGKDGVARAFLDCESAMLISPADLESESMPAWAMRASIRNKLPTAS